MSWAYRCSETGIIEFPESGGKHSCQYCDGEHLAYQIGAPPAEEGIRAPHVIGDELNKHFDWAAGCEIDSKSQRRRIYKQKGLRLKSIDEHYRDNPAPNIPSGKTFSFKGQTNHRTAAERYAVRTKTGQRVI